MMLPPDARRHILWLLLLMSQPLLPPYLSLDIFTLLYLPAAAAVAQHGCREAATPFGERCCRRRLRHMLFSLRQRAAFAAAAAAASDDAAAVFCLLFRTAARLPS